MNPKIDNKKSLPRLDAKEFDFIRINAGLTYQQIADFSGKLSRSTIYNWKLQRVLKPYQVKILMDMIPENVFEDCRRLYQEQIAYFEECRRKHVEYKAKERQRNEEEQKKKEEERQRKREERRNKD